MDRGKRYNKGKLRYELIPTFAKKAIAEVYTKGAHKYSTYMDENGNIVLGKDIPLEDAYKYKLIESAANNWRKGMSWLDTLASIERHSEAYKAGEDLDPELKTYHAANAAWGWLALLEYYKIAPELDDRPHKYLEAKKIGLDIDEVISDFVGAIMEMEGMTERPVYWNCPDLVKGYEKIKNKPEFWLNIKPKVDPKGLPFEPHCYITARPAAPEITEQWLDLHGFPKRKIWNVGVDGSKVEVAKASGIDIFVDDRYENFVELNKAGILTYLMDAPHNQRYDAGFKRIKSLKELV